MGGGLCISGGFPLFFSAGWPVGGLVGWLGREGRKGRFSVIIMVRVVGTCIL